MIYHRGCSTTGATSEKGTAYHFGDPRFLVVFVLLIGQAIYCHRILLTRDIHGDSIIVSKTVCFNVSVDSGFIRVGRHGMSDHGVFLFYPTHMLYLKDDFVLSVVIKCCCLLFLVVQCNRVSWEYINI
jgi:hypothetical protein